MEMYDINDILFFIIIMYLCALYMMFQYVRMYSMQNFKSVQFLKIHYKDEYSLI